MKKSLGHILIATGGGLPDTSVWNNDEILLSWWRNHITSFSQLRLKLNFQRAQRFLFLKNLQCNPKNRMGFFWIIKMCQQHYLCYWGTKQRAWAWTWHILLARTPITPWESGALFEHTTLRRQSSNFCFHRIPAVPTMCIKSRKSHKIIAYKPCE